MSVLNRLLSINDQETRISASAKQDQTPRKLLLISPTPDDDAELRRILGGTPWVVSAVANYNKATGLLRRRCFSVVFCESALSDGTWRDVLNDLRRENDRTPLVVTSRLADDYLWAEVLNVGGYDVLATPFNGREVAHVLTNLSLTTTQAPIRARAVVAG